MTFDVNAVIADVILSFQKRPGIDDDSIINAGDAKKTDSGDVIKPQGKGYYCLKMEEGTTCELELLGSKYKITHQPNEALEIAKDDLATTSWKVLGDNTKNGGIKMGITPGLQRRLQILGYYSGAADGKMGSGSERAILNFQADNGLRADGEAKNKTRDKIDKVINSKCKTGDIYIVRQSLIRFTRAPSATNPKAFSAWPSVHAPEIDDRGFLEVKALGFDFKGPVTTIPAKRDFRVKVIREKIAIEATLEARSSDPNLVEIITSPLPNAKEMILELRSKDIEKKPKPAEIKILCKSGGKDIEIGNLLVVVVPTIVIVVRPYMVTISADVNLGAGGVALVSQGPAKNQNDFNKTFNIANAIWAQHGVYFKFLSWKAKTVKLSKPGRLGCSGANWKVEFDKLINGNDSAGAPSAKDVLNLLIVNEIEDALGLGCDAYTFSWPNGVALAWDNDYGELSTGINLAHEFGHFFTLARTTPSTIYIHADDDPSDTVQKDDIWTLRQLMVGRWPADVRPKEPWAHNNGYGKPLCGCLVTIKDLPEVSSHTDNACSNARKWAANKAKLYCKP
jgi:hypothetical protein